MASFIDKIKSKRRSKSYSQPIASGSNVNNGCVTPDDIDPAHANHITFHGASLQLRSPVKSDDMVNFGKQGDLGQSNFDGRRRIERKCRLCKTLLETLKDPSALHYFLQYMDRQNVLHLLKFWLDAESYRVASNTQFVTSPVLFSVDSGPSNSALRTMTKDDAVNIFSKYVAKDANPNIGVTDAILNQVIDRICPEGGYPDSDCFVPATNFVFKILESRYFTGYCTSVYYLQHILDVVISPAVDLTDILASDILMAPFTEFLDLNGVKHVVEFLITVESFKSDRTFDKEIVQGDAMLLYDKYISMQAPHSIGLSESVRISVENEICREEGTLPYCFDKAVKIVLNLLENTYLPVFLQSESFHSLLLNLRHNISNTLELPDIGGRRKGGASSDRSSSLSFGSSSTFEGITRLKNTLLAGTNSPMHLQRPRQMSTASSEDISFSPDLLASKKDRKKFNVSVDEFGQYKRDYDTSDLQVLHENASQSITAKMKHRLKKDTKREEEIAAQMAQLIVQNVTQMTHGELDVSTHLI